MLKHNTTAVEVAIAILACECVASPEYTGFGGGFVAMIYRKKTDTVETLIATEWSHIAELPGEEPIHFVGVPGMLKGLWEMYKRYETSMGWDSLMKGAHQLAKEYAEGNQKRTKEFGDDENLILSKRLQETIDVVMYHEPKEFYEGELGLKFIKDIQDQGGTMRQIDLQEYE